MQRRPQEEHKKDQPQNKKSLPPQLQAEPAGNSTGPLAR